MRIEIRGRNVEVTEELRDHVHKRFDRISEQVSDLARLEVELWEERNPSIRDKANAEARLHLKGGILVATESAPEMRAAIKAEAQLDEKPRLGGRRLRDAAPPRRL